MATKREASVVQNMFGAHSAPLPFPESASLNIPIGSFVKLSSGYLVICAADDTDLLGITIEATHNSALGGAANAPMCKVVPFLPGTIIGMNLGGATSIVITHSQIGVAYGIVKETVNSVDIWCVDTSDTTNTRLRIVRFEDAIGEANGRVHVEILVNSMQLLQRTPA